MRFLLILFALALSACSEPQQKQKRTAAEEMKMYPVVEQSVYVCTGGYARKYHRYSGCRGLNACNGDVKKITKQQAERAGREPCKICY